MLSITTLKVTLKNKHVLELQEGSKTDKIFL